MVISLSGEFFGVIRNVALGLLGALIERPRTKFWIESVSDLEREWVRFRGVGFSAGASVPAHAKLEEAMIRVTSDECYSK